MDKFYDMVPIIFDIETTGFTVQDKFVCSVFYNMQDFEVDLSIPSLSKTLSNLTSKHKNILLVTYNGENYRGGFDFPFLRTKMLMNYSDAKWIFKGIPHLDIYPLFDNRFNTKHPVVKPPAGNTPAQIIKGIANENDVDYQNKNQALSELKELEDVDWLGYERKTEVSKTDNQSVYQLFFDPKGEEEYIDGEQVPELYEQKEIKEIIKHCKNDVKRTGKLYELIVDYAPDWEISRNIKQL